MDGAVMTNEQAALLAAAYTYAPTMPAQTTLAMAEQFLTWLDSRTARQDTFGPRPDTGQAG